MWIRRLSVEDSELAAAAVREFKARVISVVEARAFLAESRHYVLVADDDGEPAGLLLTYRLDRIDLPDRNVRMRPGDYRLALVAETGDCAGATAIGTLALRSSREPGGHTGP